MKIGSTMCKLREQHLSNITKKTLLIGKLFLPTWRHKNENQRNYQVVVNEY